MISASTSAINVKGMPKMSENESGNKALGHSEQVIRQAQAYSDQSLEAAVKALRVYSILASGAIIVSINSLAVFRENPTGIRWPWLLVVSWGSLSLTSISVGIYHYFHSKSLLHAALEHLQPDKGVHIQRKKGEHRRVRAIWYSVWISFGLGFILLLAFTTRNLMALGPARVKHSTPAATSVSTPTTPASTPTREITAQTFAVTRIVDGVTFKVLYDGEETSVRLFGIDAPERRDPNGPTATAALGAMIDGKFVRLTFPGTRKRDNFGGT